MARLPEQIGKYEVVDRIGKGGMGMVYKARHPTLDRFVILKKLNISGDAVMRERFRREAEIMIDFRTDYVVDVYDHFRHASSDYIALEYIDGASLDEVLLRERYLPNDLALAIIRDCCRGLAYVHSKGVVHRDVKPGNVIVGRDGAVKLVDFGVASRTSAFEDDLTSEGMTLGTVAYIAPEQIEHSRSVDFRADIYSTGAMLYEMATGRKAFSGGFNPETVNRIQRGRYRRPRRVNPQVSRLTSRIIRRCMQRKPGRRYQSAARIVSDINRYFRRAGEDDLRERIALLSAGDSASGAETGGQKTRRGRRRRWLRIAVAVFIGLLALAAASYVTGYFQRYFLSDSHSLVQYQIRLRKGERTVREHLIRLDLEATSESEAGAAAPWLPLLHTVPSLETPDYIVLRSRLLTIPAGRYRSGIRIDQMLLREERVLEPLSDEWDVQLLQATWDPNPVAELDIEIDAIDAASGEEIAGVRKDVQVDGRWFPLSGSLFSVRPVIAPGQSVTVRLTHPRYTTVTSRLETDETSEELRVRIHMEERQ